MTKKYLRTLVACLGLWGGLVHGSEVSASEEPDALETHLRACCEAAQSPESYEDARAAIDAFVKDMPRKNTVLSQMAHLEASFKVPEWLSLNLTGQYALQAKESDETLDAVKEYAMVFSYDHFDRSGPVAKKVAAFCQRANIDQTDFDALGGAEKIDAFIAFDDQKTQRPMRRLENDVPQMIRDAAFHLFNKQRTVSHFPLLYYSFMVRPQSARLEWWQTLVAWRAWGSYGQGFEEYRGLFDALMDLPHTPFPFPGEAQISPVTVLSSQE